MNLVVDKFRSTLASKVTNDKTISDHIRKYKKNQYYKTPVFAKHMIIIVFTGFSKIH